MNLSATGISAHQGNHETSNKNVFSRIHRYEIVPQARHNDRTIQSINRDRNGLKKKVGMRAGEMKSRTSGLVSTANRGGSAM